MPRVKDIYQLLTCEAKTVNETASKQEVIKVMTSGSPLARSVYVVDNEGKLKGTIALGDVIKGIAVQKGLTPGSNDFKSIFKLFQYSPYGAARDMMRPPVYATMNMKLQEALEIMIDSRLNELPVINDEGKVIGDLNAFELLKLL